jgi:hypothetical protein
MKYYLADLLAYNDRNLEIFKEKHADYDIVVGNMYTKLSVIVVKPEFLKEFFRQLPKLNKNPFIADVFNLMNGGGILFA